MFDDSPAEPGKLHRGFLTDEQGRRIYFPTFGPARWVPSPEQEKAFNERIIWCTIAGFVVAMVVLLVLILAIDTYSNGYGHAVVIMFVGRLLGERLLVRRWPMMDDASITYDRIVRTGLLRRSIFSLCFLALIALLGAIACIALPVWGYWFGPVNWSGKSIPEQISGLYVSAVFVVAGTVWCLFQANRVFSVLRGKLRGSDALPS